MIDYPGILISVSWILFLVYWLIASFSAKKIVRGERGAGIGRRILMGATGYFLIFHAADPRFGVLSHRFVPERLWIVWGGAVMTLLGILFAIWARVHIGKYWSATVALKSDHHLIRSGPYARIRHPIYTGILLGLAGSVLTIGRYASLLGLAIFLVAFWLKSRKEEALLAAEFGPAFEDHRRATGFLLPKLLG
jgi:protein-S-isoprenylcysteine O-methyltransferase Ste14